jgi:hypothetical protein
MPAVSANNISLPTHARRVISENQIERGELNVVLIYKKEYESSSSENAEP